MTDPFTPATLSLATGVETIASATSEATAEILMGEALRRIIAERLAQVTKHGHTPENDQRYDGPDLAAAAMAYLGAFIELEINPDYRADSHPDCWPWETLYWKEPRYADRLRALVKPAR